MTTLGPFDGPAQPRSGDRQKSPSCGGSRRRTLTIPAGLAQRRVLGRLTCLPPMKRKPPGRATSSSSSKMIVREIFPMLRQYLERLNSGE